MCNCGKLGIELNPEKIISILFHLNCMTLSIYEKPAFSEDIIPNQNGAIKIPQLCLHETFVAPCLEIRNIIEKLLESTKYSNGITLLRVVRNTKAVKTTPVNMPISFALLKKEGDSYSK